MKTKQYYDDSKKVLFDAKVIASQPEGNDYWIGLDETCFYYEAGGMSSDIGVLGGFPVLEVKEEEGIIYHLVEKCLSGKVTGEVDAKSRKEKIEVHTAQHLISYLIERDYGGDTISHHVSEDSADIEFSCADFTEIQLRDIEEKANQMIEESLAVTISYPSREEVMNRIGSIKTEHEQIRVVTIGEYDYNLCGCMHVSNTSEIKAIQLLGVSKTKQGIRIEYIAGDQLLRYLKTRVPVLQAASISLALPQKEIVSGIERLKEQNKQYEYDLGKGKQQYCDLLVNWELSQFDGTILVRTYENLEVKDLQYLAARFIKEKEIAVVLQLKKGDQAHIIISKNEKVETVNAKVLFEALKEEYDYKGGGSDKVAQGGGSVIVSLQEWVSAHS